jgi:hypothetical protein
MKRAIVLLGFVVGCRFDVPEGSPEGGSFDAPREDHLVFSAGDVTIKQRQRARLRVLAVLTDGTMQDVTANATYESDSLAVATGSTPGQIDAGAQAGTATITASRPGARSGSLKVTVSTKSCAPVINELQTGNVTATDEWVEILNPCTAAVTVNSWTLVYRGDQTTGATDSSLLMTLTGQLQPGEIKLFAGQGFGGANDGTLSAGLAQVSGAVALRMGALSTGPIADSLTYGGTAVVAGHPFTEGAPLPAMANGRSAARLPFDGRDIDDNSMDFMQVTTSTPRAPNAP